MKELDHIQKYSWTVTGMRPAETDFGAMTYYREIEVWSLVHKLVKHIEELEAARTSKDIN